MTSTSAPSISVVFHPVVVQEFRAWAAVLNVTQRRLREITRTIVSAQHHEAAIDSVPPMHPLNIYTLPITPTAFVYFTIEAHACVVRGYGYEIDREPLDDFDGGGFVTEYEWCSSLSGDR